jgi:hypothetical protein
LKAEVRFKADIVSPEQWERCVLFLLSSCVLGLVDAKNAKANSSSLGLGRL